MSGKNVQFNLHLIQEYESIKNRGDVAFFDEFDFKHIIEYYEAQDQIEEALNAVEDALINHTFNVDFFIKKAELLLFNNNPVLALEVLNTASLYSPNASKIQILKAEALVVQGFDEEAFQILENLKSQNLSSLLPEILLAEALIYEYKEQYENAFYILMEVLKLNPKSQHALERFWLCVEFTRKYEESIDFHKKLINKTPFSHLAWYNLGHSYAYLGNYDEAIDALEYAILSNEKFEAAYRDCAELCFEMNYYQKALNWYQDMLQLFEPDSELFLRLGQCHQFLGNYPTARTFLTRSMHLDHLNDEVYFHLGECFSCENKWQSAINAYEKAIDIEDNREEYFAAIAKAYFQLGDIENAQINFEKATSIVPEEVKYWILYSSFLIATGQADLALQVIEEAEEYVSEGEVLYCKIACLFELGKRQEAYYWLGEALSEYFGHHQALFQFMPKLQEDPAILSLIANYTI